MSTHIENHPHAFIDSEGVIKQVLLFYQHDVEFLEQTKERFGCSQYVSLCEVSGEACINGLFIDGTFIHPQPFPSWTLDRENKKWVPPVPKPEGEAVWDEQSLNWISYSIATE